MVDITFLFLLLFLSIPFFLFFFNPCHWDYVHASQPPFTSGYACNVTPHKHWEMGQHVQVTCFCIGSKLFLWWHWGKLSTMLMKVNVLMCNLATFFMQRAIEMQGLSDFSARFTKKSDYGVGRGKKVRLWSWKRGISATEVTLKLKRILVICWERRMH